MFGVKKRRPRLRIEVGGVAYGLEDVSGDSWAAFSFGDGFVAILISDGMGTGSPAAEQSRMVAESLRAMLLVGYDVESSIKKVNQLMLRSQDQEVYATMDLMVIHRLSGQAKLYKMGASVTFLLRNQRVFTASGRNLPVGITGQKDFHATDLEVKKGDVLVMVSDGVTNCDRNDPECRWMKQELRKMQTTDPVALADSICKKAMEKYGERERDDITAMVAIVDD